MGVSAASDNIKLGSCAHPLTKTEAAEDDITEVVEKVPDLLSVVTLSLKK